MAGLTLSDIDPNDVVAVSPPPNQAGQKPAPLTVADINKADIQVVEEPPSRIPPQPLPSAPKSEQIAWRAFKGLDAIGQALDKYTGAPSRAAVDAAVSGENPLKAFWSQFGEDPAKAPKMRETAAKMGVSTKTFPVPGTKAPNDQPYRVSPADVVGFAGDALVDWSNFIPVSAGAKAAGSAFKGGAKGTAKATASAVKGTAKVVLGKEAAEAAGVKMGNAITGVPEKDIRSLGAMPAGRAAAVPEKEALKDVIDTSVAELVKQREAAKHVLTTEEQALEQKYKEALADLKSRTVPLAQAQSMGVMLEDSKRALGSLSEQADDALARSGASFQKVHLLELFDKIGREAGIGEKGALVGDKATAAVQRLYAQRQRVAEGFGDTIPATDLRGILKQIRDDIDYNQQSGEFNDTLNRMRKSFATSVSGVLKDTPTGGVKEYKAYMDRMSALSQNHEQLVQYFGTPEKALSSLNSLAKGGKSAQMVQSILDQNAKLTRNTAPLDALKSFQGAKVLLDQAKVRDLRAELLPDEWAGLNNKWAAYEKLDGEISAVERLTPENTWAVINGMGRKEPNPELRKSLEALERLTGKKILQDIADRNTVDAFGKDATRGSRLANWGATLGGAIGAANGGVEGGALGAFLGASGGAYLDKQGPRLLQQFIESSKTPNTKLPTMTPADLVKSLKSRNRLDYMQKAAQQSYINSDEASAKRDAMKRRLEREGKK